MTQVPLKKDAPWGQRIQSSADEPQVLHDDEHGEHCTPSLNAPLGHVTPSDVTDGD